MKLHTLGSVYIADANGAAMGGAAAQRRLLALLAVLAVADEGGISRDRLLGLLWPDADPERARHALNQALYNARRALRCDDLFVAGGTDVRLNAERLGSDVRLFADALRRGDREGALGEYRGPFLDGFFVAGAADFEQWATAQRARLADQAVRALDELAAQDEAAGEWRSAADSRKRLVALTPFDSAAVLRLMSALAAAGDRAGALQQARVHELLLREQLEVPPDPAIGALVARLREESAAAERAAMLAPTAVASATPTEAQPALVIAPDSKPAPEDQAEAVPVPEASPPAALPPRSARRSDLPRRLLVLAAGAFLGAAAVAGLRAARPESVPAAAPAGSQSLVIAPFRVAGADPSLAFLQEGMVELLAIRLAEDSDAHAVDPGAVLAAWRGAGLLRAADVPQPEVARLAARLGARAVVVGSVVGNAARIVLTASVLGVPGGEVRARETVDGPLDSLPAIVDRLAVQLLAADADEGTRLTRGAPPSLAALRAYLNGRGAHRRGDLASAIDQYERALRQDSTFALAALHLALAADRMNEAEPHDRALALAWAARDAMSDRDRAHLLAFAGPRYPAPSAEAEQLAAWEAAAALAPDRADVWLELGERFFHQGPLLGVVDWRQRATSALERALALDPSSDAARRLVALAAARAEDSAALARVASPAALRDSVGELAAFVRWRVALARGDGGALRAARESMPGMGDRDLRAVAMSSLFDAVAPDDGERALRIRRARATRAADQVDALLAQHAMAMNRGRPVLALDLTEQLQELHPGSRAHLRLRVLDALYAEGDGEAATDAARGLARFADAPLAEAPRARAVQLADVCVLEQWRLARGETGSVRRALARLRAEGLPREIVPVGTSPLACAAILDAMLGVETRAPDAPARVRALDSLMLTGPTVGDAATYAHLAVSRLLERLGDGEGALRAVRRRAYLTGWPRYLATARREEGRLAAAAGDTATSRTAYARYLALRRAPEPRVAEQVRAVEREAEAGTRE